MNVSGLRKKNAKDTKRFPGVDRPRNIESKIQRIPRRRSAVVRSGIGGNSVFPYTMAEHQRSICPDGKLRRSEPRMATSADLVRIRTLISIVLGNTLFPPRPPAPLLTVFVLLTNLTKKNFSIFFFPPPRQNQFYVISLRKRFPENVFQ